MGSEMTAAAFGELGKVRRDPLAMLPFMGYHIGDYVNHWLQFGRDLPNAPRVFSVNWFRKDENGKFMWPGFGQNIRVLKWIIQRIRGNVSAVESPIGWMPKYEDLDWTGLEEFDKEKFTRLMDVDRESWKQELLSHEELFERMYDKLPKEFPYIANYLLCGAPGTLGLQPNLYYYKCMNWFIDTQATWYVRQHVHYLPIQRQHLQDPNQRVLPENLDIVLQTTAHTCVTVDRN
jgi:phosphoenolpyruvate carboxykinase (GTP)